MLFSNLQRVSVNSTLFRRTNQLNKVVYSILFLRLSIIQVGESTISSSSLANPQFLHLLRRNNIAFSSSAWVNNTGRFRSGAKHSSSSPRAADKYGDDKQEDSDPEVLVTDAAESEFRLDRSKIMLLADELFSDGKLLPLQLPTIRLLATSIGEAAGCPWSSSRCRLPEKNNKR
nr:uncharacterized serine-rich protein C215.13-like [Ipomoea batatas]